MLVQFSFKNFLSFKEDTVLDMRAVPSYKEHEENLIDSYKRDRYLRVASIYGANASGKSNICRAIETFVDIVRESMNMVSPVNGGILENYYRPFEFDAEKNPTEFEIVMIKDGSEYRYGYEYNDDRIVSEWIYRTDLETNRQSMILERSYDEINFGASIRGKVNRYKKQISERVLVITFFRQMTDIGTDVFSNVYSGIEDLLFLDAEIDNELEQKMFNSFLSEVINESRAALLGYLEAIDTGITDIECDDSDNDIKFYTYHLGSNGQEYRLSLDDESAGTKKSIFMFMWIRLAMNTDSCLIIDEMNIKLHPMLLKFLIDLFYNDYSEAQLIYTTHDATLMDKKFFRRDQIWFVQKDRYGVSELSALSDFKIRSDASFEKDYLSGVYGGIPFLDSFDFRSGD